MIDSNDRERLDNITNNYVYNSAKEEMHRMLAEDELKDVVVCVMANKQDLPNAISVSEIRQRLELDSFTDKYCEIFGTCATTGEGLYEALDWLYNAVKKKKKGLNPNVTTSVNNSNNNNNNGSEQKINSTVNEDEQKSKNMLDSWLEREDNSEHDFMQSIINYAISEWDHC